ncbi:glycosyltransferase family A protein [Bosea sp. F3-2]|uniref:glycosyltransferase family 2 protein n=1 Tax=Bosea sp. F3-2 TaxID=2599640 RepID=UPI0016558645|nr:glycosyltransferase family A protein [Bosea sp. F3-2]
MKANEGPLVSVLTPVYNGAAYLRDCIESVLSQSYENFEYIIINNASTDRTLELANEYAKRDERIRICSNDTLLPIIANHNRAFREIDPRSKYCKVVSADDLIFPECLAQMVALAEANQRVGLVGSYQLCGQMNCNFEDQTVRNVGLDPFRSIFPGTEVCRKQLLGELSVFGNPTSTMYRSDLVRRTQEFYPNASTEADTSACFSALSDADYGFVHQILSYERVHNVRQTTIAQNLNTYLPSAISDCLTYGRNFMTEAELAERLHHLVVEYYEFLGSSALRPSNNAFWTYHKSALQALGIPLDRRRVVLEAAKKCMRTMKTPTRFFGVAMERARRILN